MGKRLALIIGNSVYQDQTLARLKAPDVDVGALHDVLKDSQVGGFDDVDLIFNSTSINVRMAISEFFARKSRDDLLVLYFSGHGVLDDNGRLYLAVKDSNRNYLRASAIPAAFITDEMDNSRSRRQVLVLDCCHSGAFARGSKGSTGASVGTATAFEGKGYGRVILTASDATQYAWEGDRVIGEAENSVFTHHLVEGLQTGQADVDGDGKITVDELYDYVYQKVISQTSKQTPGKWSYREQGDIIIAQAQSQFPVQSKELKLPDFVDEIEDKLKRLFDSGLAAYWLEEWDKAIQAFQAIVEVRPDYPEAAGRLQDARLRAEIEQLQADAQSALEAEQWDQAIATLVTLADQAPDDQEIASQLAFARERQHLGELYDQARSLVRAKEWQAARRVLDKIAESAPDYPDEEELRALVEEKLAIQERQRRVEKLYRQAFKQIDDGALEEARKTLSQIQEIQPGYAESERLLAKVKAEIERQAEERKLERERGVSQLEGKVQVSSAAGLSQVIEPRYTKIIPTLRAHPWLSVSAAILVLLALFTSLNAGRIFPPAAFEATDDSMTAQVPILAAASHTATGSQTTITGTVAATEKAAASQTAAISQTVAVETVMAAERAAATQTVSAKTVTSAEKTVASQTEAAEAVIAAEETASYKTAVAQTGEIVGRIAFISDRDGSWEIYLINADGSGLTNLTGNPANDHSPAWSPDGTRIAFASDRDRNREIYVMNADGSGLTNLTGNPANDHSPAWSPDGTHIAFVSDRDGNSEIYVMNTDGSGQTQLSKGNILNQFSDWSPDGGQIAFESCCASNSWDLFVMNADGSEVKQLTVKALVGWPDWSPDGRRIVFRSNPDGFGKQDINIINADGSGLTHLMDETEPVWSLKWSPDGGRIAFISGSRGFENIYVINADGSGLIPLTDNPGEYGGPNEAPNWSPDGDRIVFSFERDGNREIYVMNADGSELTRLTDNPAYDGSPVWQP